MKSLVNENIAERNYAESYHYTDNTEDLNELCTSVINSADQVYKNMMPGLPKSLYQLKLLNSLARKGFCLESKASKLSLFNNDEIRREIIIVNSVLVIECLVEDSIINHYKKRIMFDVENNGHIMGLLINFGEGTPVVNTKKVFQNVVSH